MAAKKTKKKSKQATVKKGARARKESASSPQLPNVWTDRDLEHHFQNIKHFQALAKTASTNLSTAKKRAREAGVSPEEIADAMKMERMDTLELQSRIKQKAALMNKLGLGVQIQMFETKYDSPEQQAKVEGNRDGAAARVPSEQFAEGRPGHAEYMKAWTEANAANIKNNPDRGDGKEFEEAGPK